MRQQGPRTGPSSPRPGGASAQGSARPWRDRARAAQYPAWPRPLLLEPPARGQLDETVHVEVGARLVRLDEREGAQDGDSVVEVEVIIVVPAQQLDGYVLALEEAHETQQVGGPPCGCRGSTRTRASTSGPRTPWGCPGARGRRTRS